MTLTVTVSYAQRATTAINDRGRIARSLEPTSTNTWRLIEDDEFGYYDQEEVEEIAQEIELILENAGIPREEYEVEL